MYYKKGTDRIHPTELEFDIANPGNATLFSEQEQAYAHYEDQILPFDIVIYAANEYGTRAYQVVYGVEILNAGAGISVDDITNEMQMTFVAQSITPWQRLSTGEAIGTAATQRIYERSLSGVGGGTIRPIGMRSDSPLDITLQIPDLANISPAKVSQGN